MILNNDLYTVHGELLARKGQEMTPILVRKIRLAGNKHRQALAPLKITGLFEDFKRVFRDSRYADMLKPPVSREEILGACSTLVIEGDLLSELKRMKRLMPYTYNHLLIVAALAIKLALSDKTIRYDKRTVAHCGFTHDIGKTRIPLRILNKHGRLAPEERSMIEDHTVIGYLLLNYYLKHDRRDCALASLDHHERLDGSGYPKGIKRLNKYTQLISTVDVMDALLTKRPYRTRVFSLRAVFDYLLKESEKHRFNKEIVLRLISFARKDKPNIRSVVVSKIPRNPLPEELTHDKYR